MIESIPVDAVVDSVINTISGVGDMIVRSAADLVIDSIGAAAQAAQDAVSEAAR